MKGGALEGEVKAFSGKGEIEGLLGIRARRGEKVGGKERQSGKNERD